MRRNEEKGRLRPERNGSSDESACNELGVKSPIISGLVWSLKANAPARVLTT
jgi:hypothetical protein